MYSLFKNSLSSVHELYEFENVQASKTEDETVSGVNGIFVQHVYAFVQVRQGWLLRDLYTVF